jgi:DNA-binding NarL/FixJ family response regulator
MSISVLVVDDQPVVCEGLNCLFADTNVTVVGHVRDGNQVTDAFRKHRPDVALFEIQLSGIDGLILLEETIDRNPGAKVIVYSSHDTPTNIARCAALGAKEFLRKSVEAARLVAVINAVAGDLPIPDSLIAEYQGALRRRRTDADENVPLTNREIQVLRHVAMGLSNREIGKSLEISIETVKEHVQNILRKLDVNDRTQAAVWAVRRELI